MRIAQVSSAYLSVLSLMALPLFFGCHSNTSGGLRSGAGGGGVGGGTPLSSFGGAGGGDTKSATSAGGAGAGGSVVTSGSGGIVSTCAADSPCVAKYKCTSDGRGYQPYADVDCHSICGSGPCSGTGCTAQGSPVSCPTGARCVDSETNSVDRACQPTDGGVADAGLKPPLDAAGGCTAGSTKCEGNRILTCDTTGGWKSNKDVCPYACVDGACVGNCTQWDLECQGSTVLICNANGAWETNKTCPDTCSAGQCVESCVAGDRRCKGLVPQSCTTAGLWQDNRACLYLCSGGACAGECTPGNRRCRDNTVQICSSAATWVEQEGCTGSTCAAGQCVATCLAAGQDCTDPKTSCCSGSECVNTVGKTYACRAVTCAALAGDCKANTDCCAGLDCSAGKCTARAEGCSEKPTDGSCSAQSTGTCCPDTICGSVTGYASAVCTFPTGTKPQDVACLRDKPAPHDPCSAARLGLSCTYSDWAQEPGVFYTCTCSYFGWTCEKGYYV